MWREAFPVSPPIRFEGVENRPFFSGRAIRWTAALRKAPLGEQHLSEADTESTFSPHGEHMRVRGVIVQTTVMCAHLVSIHTNSKHHTYSAKVLTLIKNFPVK